MNPAITYDPSQLYQTQSEKKPVSPRKNETCLPLQVYKKVVLEVKGLAIAYL